jgi:hypothetical protein
MQLISVRLQRYETRALVDIEQRRAFDDLVTAANSTIGPNQRHPHNNVRNASIRAGIRTVHTPSKHDNLDVHSPKQPTTNEANATVANMFSLRLLCQPSKKFRKV